MLSPCISYGILTLHYSRALDVLCSWTAVERLVLKTTCTAPGSTTPETLPASSCRRRAATCWRRQTLSNLRLRTRICARSRPSSSSATRSGPSLSYTPRFTLTVTCVRFAAWRVDISHTGCQIEMPPSTKYWNSSLAQNVAKISPLWGFTIARIKSNQVSLIPYIKKEKADRKSADRQTHTHTYPLTITDNSMYNKASHWANVR